MRKSISTLVKNKKWQRTRKSLLGKWKEDPEGCVQILRDFIGDLSSCHENKIRIVHNYITGSGFRSGRIKHPAITTLYQEILQERRRRGL